LPESAVSNYEAVMTKACEKLFKKLPRNQQVWIKEKVAEICKQPRIGLKFQDASMSGLLHDHVGSHSSNLLVVWSVKELEKLVVIEGVGPHSMVDDMQRRRKTFGIGLNFEGQQTSR
jgi:mRNA-degrading endonuclease RelE of RelBE toxin-antitoxin system